MAEKLPLLLVLGVAIVFLVISRPSVVTKQVDLPRDANAITFQSDRRVQVEYGITAGAGVHAALAINADGSDIGYLKGTASTISASTWSPDGTAFAIVAFDEELGNFCLTRFDASGRQCLVRDGFAPSWSPTGKHIAYTTFSRTSGQDVVIISTIETSNGAVTPLVSFSPAKIYISPVTWAPDGRTIAYAVQQDEQTGVIWTFDLVTKRSISLTTGLLPVWSPIENNIAFSRDGDVWLYDLASHRETLFVDDPKTAQPTGWSPDGRQLLFTSTRDGNSEVYRINRDGTNLVNLTNNAADDFGAVWHLKP